MSWILNLHFAFNGSVSTLIVNINDKCDDITNRVKALFGLDSEIALHYNVGWKAIILDNNLSLNDYCIQNNSTISVRFKELPKDNSTELPLRNVINECIKKGDINIFSIFSANINEKNVAKNINQQFPKEYVDFALETKQKLHIILLDRIFLKSKKSAVQIYDYLNLRKMNSVSNDLISVTSYCFNDQNKIFKKNSTTSQYIDHITINYNDLKNLNLVVTMIGVDIQIPNKINNEFDDDGKWNYLIEKIFNSSLKSPGVIIRSFDGTYCVGSLT